MSTSPPTDCSPERFRATAGAILEQLQAVIVGQEEVLRLVLTTLLAGGNALLEGVPGLGKTLIVRSLAEAIDASFSRIQFTPDLMPADIVGTTVMAEAEGGLRGWRFEPGPIFSNLVLADEINRATPKTQSALLEAMQERSVTVGRQTHHLAEPFLVLATQNPLESEGTYPLPDAQLDRFLFKLLLPFPNLQELVTISDRTTAGLPQRARKVATGEDILAMQRLAREVPIAPHVTEAAARLVLLSHPQSPGAPDRVARYVANGASPRALQGLVLAGKIRALLDGRFNVAQEDLAALAAPVLRHRLLLNFEAQVEGLKPDAVVAAVVAAAL
jgi:MoxR-like ATPase